MDFRRQFVGRAIGKISRTIRHIGDDINEIMGNYRDFFSISIYQGTSPFDLAPAAAAPSPVLTWRDVTDLKAAYVADPFMIQVDGRWYMFFEILPRRVVKGVIGMATSADGLTWIYQKVVLEEPFHLSYPCVFEAGGEIFMLPETQQAGAVRLYRADPFPTRWKPVKNLLENVQYVDSTPFQHNGKWWMFAGRGTPPLRADHLDLFHADSLTGRWSLHPASPLVSNNPHIARPGGRVVQWNGKWLRFTQDCSPRYGLRVSAFEITDLDATVYHEQAAAPEPILREAPHGWNSAGMHHVDPHLTRDGRCTACVDGWYWGPDSP